MSKVTFLLFLLSILISGCNNSSNLSRKHTIFVNLDKNNSIKQGDISILSGHVSKLDNGIFKFEFNSVGGGANYFFTYKYKEVNGDTYKGRLQFKCKSSIIKLSVVDIYNWNHEKSNNKIIYFAPKLCK